MSDLERDTGLTVSDELDAYTVSGLFMRRLSRMAETDDEIEEDGFRLQVISHTGRRVDKVRILRLEKEQDPAQEPVETSADSEITSESDAR